MASEAAEGPGEEANSSAIGKSVGSVMSKDVEGSPSA